MGFVFAVLGLSEEVPDFGGDVATFPDRVVDFTEPVVDVLGPGFFTRFFEFGGGCGGATEFDFAGGGDDGAGLLSDHIRLGYTMPWSVVIQSSRIVTLGLR